MKRSKFDLNRRTFLKATGVSLALPLLEAMIPSMAFAEEASKPILINCVWPNGLPLHYDQNTYGANRNTFVPQWILDHYLSGMSGKIKAASSMVGNSWNSWNANGFSGHYGNSVGVFMGSHGKFNNTDHIFSAPGNGEAYMQETFDQRIARHFGITPDQTLNVTMIDDDGTNKTLESLSWYKDGNLHRAAFMDTLPAKLFDRITSGANTSGADLETRRKILLEKNSLLSLIMDQTKSLKNRLGMEDKARLDEYLTGVEEVERKVASQISGLGNNTAPSACTSASINRPKDYEFGQSVSSQSEYLEKARVFQDLMTLSMECGQHSVFGFVGGNAGTFGYRLASNGIGWHESSHYINDTVLNSTEHIRKRKAFGDFAKIQVNLFKSWMERLAMKQQADGSVLFDRVFATCTSYLGEAGHYGNGIPTLMCGSGGGRVPTHNGHHFKAASTKGTPRGNIWLSVIKQMGIDENQFGLSTGTIPGFDKTHNS